MNAIAPIAPRLGQLVRMLGSDQDGEALAACRALGRTLDSADLDFHCLADTIERAALPSVVTQPRQEASPAPELNAWQVLAMYCIREGQGRLKPVELDFLRGMIHWPSQPSEKQNRWLDAIAAALGVEVA